LCAGHRLRRLRATLRGAAGLPDSPSPARRAAKARDPDTGTRRRRAVARRRQRQRAAFEPARNRFRSGAAPEVADSLIRALAYEASGTARTLASSKYRSRAQRGVAVEGCPRAPRTFTTFGRPPAARTARMYVAARRTSGMTKRLLAAQVPPGKPVPKAFTRFSLLRRCSPAPVWVCGQAATTLATASVVRCASWRSIDGIGCGGSAHSLASCATASYRVGLDSK
jgi:hypothetical protein